MWTCVPEVHIDAGTSNWPSFCRRHFQNYISNDNYYLCAPLTCTLSGIRIDFMNVIMPWCRLCSIMMPSTCHMVVEIVTPGTPFTNMV